MAFLSTVVFATLNAFAGNTLDFSDACVLLNTEVTFLCSNVYIYLCLVPLVGIIIFGSALNSLASLYNLLLLKKVMRSG